MKTLVETTEGFDIYFEALNEDLPLNDTFDDCVTDIDELNQDIENGVYVYFCAKVAAYKNGIELATEYLGACLYENEEDFYIKYHDDYFIDMRDQVIADSKQIIKELVI